KWRFDNTAAVRARARDPRRRLLAAGSPLKKVEFVAGGEPTAPGPIGSRSVRDLASDLCCDRHDRAPDERVESHKGDQRVAESATSTLPSRGCSPVRTVRA